MERRARQGALLAEVNHALASSAPLEVSVARCARAIRAQHGFSRVCVWTLSDCGGALELLACDGEPPSDDFVTEPLLVGASLIGVLGVFSSPTCRPNAAPPLGGLADALAVGIRQKSLEKAQGELQERFLHAQKMEAIGQLSGAIAHDFNNLLSVISGTSSLVLDSLPEGDDCRSDLLEIQRAGERAAALTRRLLAFSRKLVYQPRVVELNDVVRDVRKMLSRLLREDIELRVHLTELSTLVEVDPGQFEQLLMNLAVNARDAMPSGGRLTISTVTSYVDAEQLGKSNAQPSGRYVTTTIADSGCGMDQATLEHIFEPFFTTKPLGKGTGLGLSTARDIVQQAGGFIRVESTPGVGSRFHVYLPCR